MEEQTSMMGRQRADSLLRNKIGSDEKYKSLHQSLMIMSQDPAVMLICMIRDAFSIGNCYNDKRNKRLSRYILSVLSFLSLPGLVDCPDQLISCCFVFCFITPLCGC